jgi:YqjK-like protein
MSTPLEHLAGRKAALLQRIEDQRSDLGVIADDLEGRLAGVDRTIATVRDLATNPLVIAGSAVAMFAIGPRRLFSWIGRGLFFFSTARRIWQTLR